MKTKPNRRMLILIVVIIVLGIVLLTTAYAYDNSRRGMGILTEGLSVQIVDLAKCYSELSLKSKGIIFEDYYAEFKQNGLPATCSTKIAALGDKKTWYAETSDNQQDADQDLFTDQEEKAEGTDPNNVNDFPWWIDIDGDGFTNDYELSKDSDPLDASNTPLGKDSDHDGYSDDFEQEKSSDPLDAASVPQLTATPETELSEPQSAVESNSHWQLYLAGALALVLLITIIGYLVYRHRQEQ